MICPHCKKKIKDKTLKKHVYSLAGKAVSEKKSLAARENGKKGGRPRKVKEEREEV